MTNEAYFRQNGRQKQALITSIGVPNDGLRGLCDPLGSWCTTPPTNSQPAVAIVDGAAGGRYMDHLTTSIDVPYYPPLPSHFSITHVFHMSNTTGVQLIIVRH